MFYYQFDNLLLAAERPYAELTPAEPWDGAPVCFLTASDPMLGRGLFRAAHPGQLVTPDALEVLDASRLRAGAPDPVTAAALAEGRLRVVNTNRPGWRDALRRRPSAGKKRVHVLAIGDVGATLVLGLKLLGGDVVGSIGICDLSAPLLARWEMEFGQIALPWEYDALPEVEIVPRGRLFDCDLFVFAATAGIPPAGAEAGDVRMAQWEKNAALVRSFARQAREDGFRGLWAAVSDPVDPLAKAAYLESNRDAAGNWDGLGLWPEQVQGYGLGVMNARAAYYAKREPAFARFLREGRAFGPHGEDLVIADAVADYDDGVSRALTARAVAANREMRALGFKPYVAPALSSGALSLLLTLRGEWHYGSVFLDGVYMGCRNRYTPCGLETELLPAIPDALFARIRAAADGLKAVC